MELRGKSVLITGATGGLGQAIARRLHAEGCTLTLTGRRAAALKPLASEVDGRVIEADLSTEDGTNLVAEQDVDLLVANAALPGAGLLETYTPEQIDRALAVNLRSPIMLARAIGERMLARGEGHLVFISSLSGKSATPYSSLYNATKFGLRGFALALRADWEPRGVGVSCVNPGPIAEAGMFHNTGVTLPPGVGQRRPRDVADAVVKAVTQNKAEVDVADLVTRFGTMIGMLAPQAANRLGKRLGAERVAQQLAEGHRENR
jgi:short-subunit dehydrogenase